MKEHGIQVVVIEEIVALYEICFKQALKAMKEILEQQGFAEERIGSPKIVLKTAFAAGMKRRLIING